MFAGTFLVSNNYPGAATYSDAGNLLTIYFAAVPGGQLTPGTTYTAILHVTSAPEPGSLVFVLTALAVVAFGRLTLAKG